MEIQALYEIVIIGAGPAGVSLAYEATQLGVDPSKVLLLEKGPSVAESIRNFYPEDKLVTANYKGFVEACIGNLCITDMSKEEALKYLFDKMVESGVQTTFSQEVKSVEKNLNGNFSVHTTKDIFATKTVAFAIGILGNPNKPDYPIPDEVIERVHFKVPKNMGEKEKVLVVGGGDSASEYAQSLAKAGHQVTFSYRRAEINRMNDQNKDLLEKLASEGKVQLWLGSDISSIENDKGKPQIHFKTDHSATTFDHAVYALGGTNPKEFLAKIGIEYKDNRPQLDQGETSIDGLFLLGDLASESGGGSINLAFNNSFKVVREMCKNHLDCKI